MNRGLDIFDRAKADPVFASRVKSLRLHWAYEEGDMLDLMTREHLDHLLAISSWFDLTSVQAYLGRHYLNSEPSVTLSG